jgi:hypothetical protein
VRAAPRLACLALASACVQATFVADAAGTLRVDYFHTGGAGVEVFALEQVIDLYAGPSNGR